MHIPSCIAAIAAFTACANAQFTTHAAKRTAAATATAPFGGQATGCAAVQAAASQVGSSSTTFVKASDALACLQSVPLDVTRSSAFCDYIEPYFQFQSTIAYLKNPPEGWTLPGCDYLGGLAEIKSNVNSGVYKSQWEFESDLYQLGNFMPHDFHVNLPMPLVGVFLFFTTGGPLVSISSDGVSVPDIYFKNDLDAKRANPNLGWTPSPLKAVNGQDAAAYLEELTQLNSPFQDPDALFNQALTSLAFNYTAVANGNPGGNVFIFSNTFGFVGDSYNYTFANGSTNAIDNAAIPNVDFSHVSSGSDLFNLVDLPAPESAASSSAILSAAATSSTPTALPASTTYTSLFGYPTPEVIHTDGYVSGYFLENSSVAVLAMQGFIDALEQDPEAPQIQQAVIKQFLALCKQQGATKLIVDLQDNGGGDVFSGFDAFKQLFPTINPFGATRLRSTPMVNYFGTIFSEADIYNISFNSEYQIQANLDGNDQPFTSWSQEDPPDVIYGDNFTAELRYNFSDVTVEAIGAGFNVSGYLNNSDIAPQVFQAEDIVILYDGSCGSTCAVFSELMKSQGGVRSVAVGGRPQTGPMQGVAGSKGAEVLTYGSILEMYSEISYASSVVQQKGDTLPPAPSPSSVWIPSESDFPLGNSQNLVQGSRFNFRNNMHLNDTSFTPLQFIYEAANCRLFFIEDDLYDISGLWSRVADVAWNGGKCVSGSTVNSDDTIGAGPYDTVAFSSSVVSNVKQAYSPGLVALVNGNSSAPGGGTPTASSGTGSATPSPSKKAAASGLKASAFGAFVVFVGMTLLVW